MKKLLTPLKVFFTFAVLLGLIYPLFILFIGQNFFPHQAKGSLITRNKKIIGSELIAQKFNSPKYFHSRFSAVSYDATNSGGSNLAVTSQDFYKQTKKHINKVRIKNGLQQKIKLPPDLVLNSASGLDPHISLKNALLQLPRIINNRKITKQKIKKLIAENCDEDFIGIWGQTGINVLKLNLALDKLEKNKRSNF